MLSIPFVENLVVWTFLETIETFCPSKWFSNVDFPTLGGPTKYTNPDLVLIFRLHYF
jgi:hypothetical protein